MRRMKDMVIAIDELQTTQLIGLNGTNLPPALP